MIVLIGLIASIVFSVICLLSTENLYISGGVFFISFLYFAIFVNIQISKSRLKITRFHECYHFINNFLISLSIKGHISGALASALETQNDDTNDALKELDASDPMLKLKYLKNYFSFDAYFLFFDIISLYEEEGGDVIKMSHFLSNQIRETEEYINSIERLHRDSIIEFSILWCFSLLILAILKFVLSDFFAIIIVKPFYLISVIAIFAFVLISVQIAVSKITDIKIKGWSKNV